MFNDFGDCSDLFFKDTYLPTCQNSDIVDIKEKDITAATPSILSSQPTFDSNLQPFKFDLLDSIKLNSLIDTDNFRIIENTKNCCEAIQNIDSTNAIESGDLVHSDKK